MSNEPKLFERFVAGFKDYLAIHNPAAKECCPSIYADVPITVKALTKKDLYTLANSKLGSGFIDGLEGLRKIALQIVVDDAGNPVLDANGKPQFTNLAKIAIGTLNELKPNSMKLLEFVNAIQEVAGATVDIRYENDVYRIKDWNKTHPNNQKPIPKKGSSTVMENLSGVFDVSPKIQSNPLEDKKFDQQAALAMLEASGVKADKEHTLKAPLETLVIDAVKGIKQSVALAA